MVKHDEQLNQLRGLLWLIDCKTRTVILYSKPRSSGIIFANNVLIGSLLSKSETNFTIAGKSWHALVLSFNYSLSFSEYRIAPLWFELRVKMLFKWIKTVQLISGTKMRILLTISDIKHHEEYQNTKFRENRACFLKLYIYIYEGWLAALKIVDLRVGSQLAMW